MRKFLAIVAFFIISVNLISANNLQFADIEIEANQSGVIDLSLDNPDDVSQ